MARGGTGTAGRFQAWLGFLLVCLGSQWAPAAPLFRAHAHNDYLHNRPLLDALAHGFRSVEADIWLTNGQLLVAHDFDKVSPRRTLESLYLDPLRAFVKTNGREAQPLTLLIDIKSDAEPTYLRLREVLSGYADILTKFENGSIATNAVLVLVSGNRPLTLMEKEARRFAALDGRLPDLDANPAASLYPLISDNWTKHFTWRGEGTLADAEREKLRKIVARAHAQKRRVRFWAVPDSPSAWQELYAAGVDLLNTDRLAALQQWLEQQR